MEKMDIQEPARSRVFRDKPFDPVAFGSEHVEPDAADEQKQPAIRTKAADDPGYEGIYEEKDHRSHERCIGEQPEVVVFVKRSPGLECEIVDGLKMFGVMDLKQKRIASAGRQWQHRMKTAIVGVQLATGPKGASHLMHDKTAVRIEIDIDVSKVVEGKHLPGIHGGVRIEAGAQPIITQRVAFGGYREWNKGRGAAV